MIKSGAETDKESNRYRQRQLKIRTDKDRNKQKQRQIKT